MKKGTIIVLKSGYVVKTVCNHDDVVTLIKQAIDEDNLNQWLTIEDGNLLISEIAGVFVNND